MNEYQLKNLFNLKFHNQLMAMKISVPQGKDN